MSRLTVLTSLLSGFGPRRSIRCTSLASRLGKLAKRRHPVARAWSAYPDGSVDFFNQHYLDYVGLSLEQAKAGGWTVAVHADDLHGLTDAWRLMMASNEPGECEARSPL